MRPLVACLSFSRGKFILDGVQRMRERPIRDLVEGLQQLGCNTSCSSGFPPVVIDGKVTSSSTLGKKKERRLLLFVKTLPKVDYSLKKRQHTYN
jgi:5-enolpyruvylshikimate-3-phosphate synthase